MMMNKENNIMGENLNDEDEENMSEIKEFDSSLKHTILNKK